MAKKSKDAQDAPEPDTSGGLRLTDHPRAQRAIGAVKGWGGLVGFVAGILLGTRAGLPTSDAVLRGLGLGVVAYLIAWAGAVVVWRQLARAEVEQLRARFIAAAEQAEAEIERRRAELDAHEARAS